MVSVQVRGLGQLEQVADFRRYLGPVALAGLEKIAAAAADLAPIRTGKLRASIRAVPGDVQRAELGNLIAARYWHLLEYGHQIVARGKSRVGKTKGQLGRLRTALKRRRAAGTLGFVAARPFVHPALAQGEAELLASVERAFQDLVR